MERDMKKTIIAVTSVLVVAVIALVVLACSGAFTASTVALEGDAGNPVVLPKDSGKSSAKPNTIRDGVWHVGEDVKAGRYRTEGELPADTICYWQISWDPEGRNVEANDIPTGGRPTVNLKKGMYFKAHDCGVWVLAPEK
jgi:hypothetical protein